MENIVDSEIQEAKKQAQHFGVEYVSLRGKDISIDVLGLIPEDIARRSGVLVYEKNQKNISIAIYDPKKLQQKAPQILTDLKKNQGYNFTISITTKSDFDYALLGYKQRKHSTINSAKENKVDDNFSKIKTIDLKGQKIDYETLIKFPKNIAQKYHIIVFEETNDGKKVKVALEDPDNLQTQEILQFIGTRNNIEIEQYKANIEDIDWALTLYDKPLRQDKKISDSQSGGQVSERVSGKNGEDRDKMNNNTNKIKLSVSGDKGDNAVQTKKNPSSLNDRTKQTEISKDLVDRLLKDKQTAQDKHNEISDDSKIEQASTDQERIEKNSQIFEESSEEVKDLNMSSQKVDEVNNSINKNNLVIGVSSEEEQNLDKVLPNGVADIKSLAQMVSSLSVPQVVAAILYLAVKMEASDIHLQADDKLLYLRYRVDGVLKEILKIPLTLQAPVVSRIKILAKLKIDEQRIPQDGRFDVVVLDKNIDLRISTLPTIHGEKIVMRILDKSTGIIELEKLGIIGVNLKKVQEAIQKPYGIVFVTGPTGSGKTTTLYAILNKLNTPEVNIVTLEDPVEYELKGVNQCQIKPKIGFGFADGLRSILRQDPNIIMVGEVRDTETANMSTHAALTGHLVLSTLHTNDSCGALPRLIDMGVEPYLITSSINAIVAQRLVRKLCDKCKKEVSLPEKLYNQVKEEISSCPDEEIKKLSQNQIKFYKPQGCNVCKDGYKGRIGLYEVLTITDRIEQLAVNRSTASIIKRAAINQGLVTIRQDGFAKSAQGLTSVDEIIRVTSR